MKNSLYITCLIGYVALAGKVGAQSNAPQIATPPLSSTNIPGTSASFTVTATGSAPLGYQWLKNGSPMTGQTNATLTFGMVLVPNAGDYSVLVTNGLGAVTSAVATLTVTKAGKAVSCPRVPHAVSSGFPIVAGDSSPLTLPIAYPFGFIPGNSAFRWSSDRGEENLLPLSSDHNVWRVCGISADGTTIAGYSGFMCLLSDGCPGKAPDHFYACKWNAQPQPVALTTANYSRAYAVSGDGSVIVGAVSFNYY